MKKSCFIPAVIIVTILIGAIIYIVKYKLEDWLKKPAREILVENLKKDWETKLEYINDSDEKDSLKSLMIYYFENINSIKEIVNLDEENFLKEIGSVVEDSLISDEEIEKLTLLMQKGKNEKSKSNRN